LVEAGYHNLLFYWLYSEHRLIFHASPAIPRQVTPVAVEAPAEQQIFDTLSRRYHSSLPHFVKNPGKKIIQDFYFLQTAVYYLLL
jgi:hypothetical protein